MFAPQRKLSFPSDVPASTRAHIAAPWSSLLSAVLAVACTWRKRARERRALAEMAACDLADFGVPPSMAAAEARRWPWQQPSCSWQSLERQQQYLLDAARWS